MWPALAKVVNKEVYKGQLKEQKCAVVFESSNISQLVRLVNTCTSIPGLAPLMSVLLESVEEE